jgi:hypothetical protein
MVYFDSAIRDLPALMERGCSTPLVFTVIHRFEEALVLGIGFSHLNLIQIEGISIIPLAMEWKIALSCQQSPYW